MGKRVGIMSLKKKRKRKRQKERFVVTIAIAAVVLLLFVGCSAFQNDDETKPASSQTAGEKTDPAVIKKEGDKQPNDQKSSDSKTKQHHETDHKVAKKEKAKTPSSPDHSTAKATDNKNSSTKNKKNQQGQKPTNDNIVYLTFDDGPSPVTNQILDSLQTYHAKATFFMLEPRMKEYKAAVKRLVAEGHTAGLHGVTHNAHLFYQSKKTVVGEMMQDKNTLKKITGYNARLIRTPYGSVPRMKKEYRQAVKEQGFIMWDWDVDSKDWHYRDRRFVNNTIQQIIRLKGSHEKLVILLHDRPETAPHLPLLLKYLKENGYQMKALTPDMKPLQFKQKTVK